jgi:hypothetical protein
MAKADVIRKQPIVPPIDMVVLTLTPFEAEVLQTLTTLGVVWHESGRFGNAAANIYWALSEVVPAAKYRRAHAYPQPIWIPGEDPTMVDMPHIGSSDHL